MRIVARDRLAGAARDSATRTGPAAAVVRGYARELRSIDFTGAPADLLPAWQAHADAWEALAPFLERHATAHGEMHDLFRRLRDPLNPDAAEFEPLHAALFTTWHPIEQILARYGIE